MTIPTWTDDRIERLKKLWEDGFSASQIAAELGHVSRNAVIGKVHRLGLASRKTTTTILAPKKPASSTFRPVSKLGARRAAARIADGNAVVIAQQEESEDRMQASVLPVFPRVTLVELKPSSCKWPIGDPLTPEFRFCGAPTEGGSPYCSHHACLAYQPRAASSSGKKSARR